MSEGTDRILTDQELFNALRAVEGDQALIIQKAVKDSRLVMVVINNLTDTIQDLKTLIPSKVANDTIADIVDARRNLGGLFRSLEILRTWEDKKLDSLDIPQCPGPEDRGGLVRRVFGGLFDGK